MRGARRGLCISGVMPRKRRYGYRSRKDRTEVSCCVKYLMFGFNVLFWVSAFPGINTEVCYYVRTKKESVFTYAITSSLRKKKKIASRTDQRSMHFVSYCSLFAIGGWLRVIGNYIATYFFSFRTMALVYPLAIINGFTLH